MRSGSPPVVRAEAAKRRLEAESASCVIPADSRAWRSSFQRHETSMANSGGITDRSVRKRNPERGSGQRNQTNTITNARPVETFRRSGSRGPRGEHETGHLRNYL